MKFSRRALISGAALAAFAYSRRSSAQTVDGGFAWYAVNSGIEGVGFSDTDRAFDRLPSRANGVVSNEIWNLSRNSAGIAVRFRSDSDKFGLRVTHFPGGLETLSNTPSIATNGCDLYRTDHCGRLKFVANVIANGGFNRTLVLSLDRTPGVMRRHVLYLPIFNGIDTLEIGINPDSSILFEAPRSGPIVFYGTSITQGGCASRPGLAFPSILGRRLNRHTINLGFNGQGKLEPEIRDFVAEIPASAFVVDAMGNVSVALINDRMIPFLSAIRTAQPTAPIVVVEDAKRPEYIHSASERNRSDLIATAYRAAFETAAASVPNLHYIYGTALTNGDNEWSVDNAHPNSLGHFRYAAAYESVLRPLL